MAIHKLPTANPARQTGKSPQRSSLAHTKPKPCAGPPPLPARDELEDSYSATAFADVMDHASRAMIARMTAGLSPAAMMLVWADWALHIGTSPGKQARLCEKAFRKILRFQLYALNCASNGGKAPQCIEPLSHDPRFTNEAWQTPPYNLMHQAFLLSQQWWHNATTGVRGVTAANERAAEFAARQYLDVLSPSNYLLTNPEALARTWEEQGQNLLRGAHHFQEDFERQIGSKQPVGAEAYKVGENLALTPGKIVFRNELIELIQYSPTTKTVHPEPILIVPAWIMKYYILDLRPENSMVKYLVDQGFTVFMISWKNPGPEDRNFGMDDYLHLGPMSALNVISDITKGQKIHGTGYCLGGTLLSIAAAAMARDGDSRLASVTFLASQSDFSEAGELMLFVNESEVTFLEDMMWEQGFLDSKQMAGAFQILRSNDLVWSKMLRTYLMGDRDPVNDLMAWNADATRMPYRMHSEYLRELFLNNELAIGKYHVDGRPVMLSDIRVPVFAVGTEKDHVAPWRSVYKIHALTDTDVTFLLTSGGHNAGVVSEPGHPGRHFRIHTSHHGDHHLSPDEWAVRADLIEGSWWEEWVSWLEGHSGKRTAPPYFKKNSNGANALQDAPGSYVMMM